MKRKKTTRKAPKSTWAAHQVPFEHLLMEDFIGQPEVCSKAAGLMASLLLRKGQDTSLPLPRTLLVGPTSAGKSYLVELVAKHLQVPTAHINAATLTSPGYKGLNVSDGLAGIWEDQRVRKNGHPFLIIIDELDKLSLRSRQDEWIKQVEYNLLPILNGDPIRIPDPVAGYSTIEVHTKNALVFCMGVFSSIGATSWKSITSSQKAVRRFGFGEEFVSRFSHFIPLKKPTKKSAQQMIARGAQNIASLYASGNWRPSLPKSTASTLAQQMLTSPFGLRGVRGEIHQKMYSQAKSSALEMLV